MKRVLLAVTGILLAIIVVIGWKFIFPKKRTDDDTKPQGLTVSKHTDSFNQSMMTAMDTYYKLAEAFVNWDTATVYKATADFKIAVDSIHIQEMEKDSSIYPTVQGQWESIKSEIVGMQADTSIYQKREDLNSLSLQMFDLLRIVKYDAAKVYYQECPMALNNYESKAYWLSTTGDNKSRRNPYLGLYDPKFGRAMLACGTTKDSINFVQASTGK